jgi:hypothetical protein
VAKEQKTVSVKRARRPVGIGQDVLLNGRGAIVALQFGKNVRVLFALVVRLG